MSAARKPPRPTTARPPTPLEPAPKPGPATNLSPSPAESSIPTKAEAAPDAPARVEAPAPSETAPKADKPKEEKLPKVFAEWSGRPPVAVLVLSGEQDGYPDPCGCTEGQLGGLGRRYDLIQKMEAKGWPLAKLDLGNLIQFRANSRGGPEQEKIKFGIIHRGPRGDAL